MLARVEAGRLAPTDAILKPPEAIQGLDLYWLLLACPGIGRSRARTVCERAKVWPHLALCEMTDIERRAIIDHLPGD